MSAIPPPVSLDEEIAPPNAARWAAYIEAAESYLVVTPLIYPEKREIILHGAIPGFEGLVYRSSDAEHFLIMFPSVLERWLEYRLANRLPIPLLPGVEMPTLEDFEEYDAIRAYDAAVAAGETPIPFEEALAAIEVGH